MVGGSSPLGLATVDLAHLIDERGFFVKMRVFIGVFPALWADKIIRFQSRLPLQLVALAHGCGKNKLLKHILSPGQDTFAKPCPTNFLC